MLPTAKGASMAKSSKRVVLAALAGNGAIALAKFAAAGISGSTATLTQAIHPLVDTADQVLLLVGQTRGERRADATHPLGYGMEVYFWSFVVALMVFLVGGVLSMYEGVRQILNPIPVISPWISVTVLAVAAGFESTSFRIAYREYRRVVRGRPTRLWAFIKASKDPTLFAVLLEEFCGPDRHWLGGDRRDRFRLLPYHMGRRRGLGSHWPFAHWCRLGSGQRDQKPYRRRGRRADRHGATERGT